MYISENDKAVIRQLIEKQLQAFQKQDEVMAFSLTSPTVQRKFQQQDFLSMVKKEYPAIATFRSIVFRGYTLVNDFPALVCMIMDQDGRVTQGIFIVQHQPDYSWRIHGYELISVDEKIM